ncbi:hypothetical protein PLESTF_000963700 [Pleodorina starrii]|nr:hypothetical protein PLESTF_000963700 [Pleodorina starrii]
MPSLQPDDPSAEQAASSDASDAASRGSATRTRSSAARQEGQTAATGAPGAAEAAPGGTDAAPGAKAAARDSGEEQQQRMARGEHHAAGCGSAPQRLPVLSSPLVAPPNLLIWGPGRAEPMPGRARVALMLGLQSRL